MENDSIVVPQEIRPVSTMTYVGFRILFLIPIVGFVLALVMSFAPKNINLKYFCRSQLILMLILVALYALFLGIVYFGMRYM